jgi:hypothetical protein
MNDDKQRSKPSRRELNAFLAAEPFPIAKMLPQTPLELRHLRLPPICTVEILSPLDRRMTGWHNATWNDLQAQRRILMEESAWGLLANVLQLSQAVEPLMREDPALTLAEAMALLSRKTS